MATTWSGIDDTKSNLILPPGWDAAFLANNFLKAEGPGGTSYADVFAFLQASLTKLDNVLMNTHRFIPALTYRTKEDRVSYSSGGSGKMDIHTEFSNPGIIHTTGDGHMLPLRTVDKALAWTMERLEESLKFDDIQRDVTTLNEMIINTYEERILSALFRIEDVPIAASGICSPIVGGGSLPYTPPDHAGKQFPSDHSHFFRIDETNVPQYLAMMTRTLVEHGLVPPFRAFYNDTDAEFWQGINDTTHKVSWLEYSLDNVTHATDETRLTSTQTGSRFTGAIKTPSGLILMQPISRLSYDPILGHIDDMYLGIYMSGGPDSPLNPIAWRYNPIHGPVTRAANGFQIGMSTQNIIVKASFGANVGANRLNGALLRVAASGDYVSPIIT